MAIRTLGELFYDSVDRYDKAEHLRYKEAGAWKSISSKELRTAVEETSMGLRALGIDKGDRVAILSENRPEWMIADLATLTASATDTPIYATLPAPQVLYILNDSEAKVVFVSSELQARKIADIRDQAPHLKHVILMERETPLEGTTPMAQLRAAGMEALAKDPKAVRMQAAEAKADDLATLIYTSGTTGDPKGVMLLHSNLVSNVEGSRGAFAGFGPADTYLSFLPLAHVFERMVSYLLLNHGVTIAYAESFDKLSDNMLEVKPTFMCSVPRLFEKIRTRIQEKVAADPQTRQNIFHWALRVGRELFKHRLAETSPGPALALQGKIADALVFKKIRERTGGRLRLFVSGGAPLSREISEFFGSVGLPILEGYGLTETSPVICVNTPQAWRPGSVGRPIPGVEVKVGDDGEILTRGPHVMKGYFKRPDATAEAIDADGWFHTGDVGLFDPDGYLVITDRKKDIIVTSGGKNIAPQPIEGQLKLNNFFGEVVMVGNRRNFPAALVVPNFETLEKWAKAEGLSFSTRQDLTANAKVKAHYERLVAELSKDLAQFERIKKIHLLAKEFSIDAGELTPKLSVKRKVVETKYQGVIDAMYQGAPPV